MASRSSHLLDRLLDAVGFTWTPDHRSPALRRVLVATAIAVTGSLIADAVLVALGTTIVPSIRGYEHFRFFDYASLTVIGVLVASAGWPVVVRFTTAPRQLFRRLAVLTTLVLFLPDFWLLAKGGPAKAVGVLMLMHVAIAVVTYESLVRLAPVRHRRPRRRAVAAAGGGLSERANV